MPPILKSLLAELKWLLLLFIVSILAGWLLFGNRLINGRLTFEWEHVNFITSPLLVLLFIFLLLTFIAFFIKEARRRFARALPNRILLVSGTGVLIMLVLNDNILLLEGGWTAYPPLSDLPFISPDQFPDRLITYSTQILTLLITGSLLYITYKWGTQRKPGL